MKRIFALFVVFFLMSACTTTYVKRTDGDKTFEAGNTSIGWDREDVRFDLNKELGKLDIKIGIGKSGGSAGLDRAITGLEKSLETLKALRP